MEYPDFKKLTVWFLIVAAISSSAMFVFSNFVGQGTPANQNAGGKVGDNGIAKNGFVESIPSSGDAAIGQNAYDPSKPLVGDNLTEKFSKTLADNIIQANPEGPQNNAGVLNIKNPDPQTIVNQYASSAGKTPVIPAIDDSSIKIQKKFSQDDIMAYLQSAKQILNNTYGTSGIMDLSQKDPGPDLAAAINLLFAQNEAALYALQVPEPLADLHRSLLTTLETQKQMFDLNSSDPLRTALLIQNTKTILASQKQAINKELTSLQTKLPQILQSAIQNEHTKNLAQSILFINEAHAIIVSTAIANLITELLTTIVDTVSEVFTALDEWISEQGWIIQLVLTYLRDVIIKYVQDLVINWVNGSGKPKYVTNWKKLFGDAANSAAGELINKEAPALCKSFGPLVSVAVKPIAIGPSRPKIGCTLTSVVGNIENFYKSFENGGWIAYGQSLGSGGSFFSAAIDLNDLATQEGAKKKEAAAAETQSGSGYQSQKTCTDQVVYDEQAQIGDISTVEDAKAAFGDNFISAECDDQSGVQMCRTITVCNPDNPNAQQVTTPGGFISDTLNKAAGSDVAIQRVVTSDSFAGLFDAIINLAVTKLAQSAVGLLTVQSAPTNKTPADVCASLYPVKTSPEYIKCKGGADSGTEAVGDANPAKERLLNEIDQMVKSAKDALPYATKASEVNTEIINLVTETIGSKSTAETCPPAKAQANIDLPNGQAIQADLNKDLAFFKNIIDNIPAFRLEIVNSKETKPNYYTQKITDLHTTFGTLGQVAQKLGEAQGKLNVLTQDTPDTTRNGKTLGGAQHLRAQCPEPVDYCMQHPTDPSCIGNGGG